MIRAGRFLFLFWLSGALLFAGCYRQSPAVPSVSPSASLLEIVRPFEEQAWLDLYRLPAPVDSLGDSLYRTTLARLKAWERAHPDGADRDIVFFVRGQACLRLGQFEAAGRHFQRVAEMADTALREKARERSAVTVLFTKALSGANREASLRDYLDQTGVQVGRLASLSRQLETDFDRSLALRERESLERERALLLFRNRYVLDGGSDSGLAALENLVAEHPESDRLASHQLLLGEACMQMARDMYLLTPESGRGVYKKQITRLLEKARRIFLRVAHSDGFPEKPEGAALFEAASAFLGRIERDW